MLGVWAASVAFFASSAIAQTQVEPSDRVRSNVVVRAGPSTGTPTIDALDPGERLEFVADLPYWYEVRLPDGRTGFVSEVWTVLVESAAGDFRVHVIDVGTGLAIFAEGPGFTLLYDAGSNDDRRAGVNNRVVAYLRRVRPDLGTIDHLILSHAHRDHLGLLPDIFEAYEVRHVWDSGRLHDTCGYLRFLQAVAAEPNVSYHSGLGANVAYTFTFEECGQSPRSIAVRLGPELRAETVSMEPGARVTFLNVDAAPHPDPNENSLVVRLDLAGRRILLTGDAEAGSRQPPSTPPQLGSIEAELLACCRALLASDVLVAGHHGSMTSSRGVFLDAVGAETFIISSGPQRYSGTSLPDQIIVEEFERRGTLWRTDMTDDTCGINPVKIGNDADGKAGGCDNILIDVASDGVIGVNYNRIAD